MIIKTIKLFLKIWWSMYFQHISTQFGETLLRIIGMSTMVTGQQSFVYNL